jgi:predicted AAA+ superfamily ATPase
MHVNRRKRWLEGLSGDNRSAIVKRDIFKSLQQWKASNRRKPLLLKGARQTGKTYALRQFGQEQYERCFYFNFEEKPEIADFFQRSLQPAKILRNLSVYEDREIRAEKDLIIFDEIQACNRALASLKYFQEEANEYHVAAAGSLLGIIKMSGPTTLPVGKVNLLDLRPMTFLEFLDAVGESRYRNLLENASDFEPFPEPFHNDLIDLLRIYYLVGGMPEAVGHYAETKDFKGVRAIQSEILQRYELDFAKHAPATDIPKLSLLWSSIPRHLSQENKRFLFSAVRKGARGRDYENALRWLHDAGLIHQAHAVEKVGIPLTGHKDPGIFKVYILDIGLLAAMSRIDFAVVLKGSDLFTSFRGALVENYVAQQLVATRGADLAYWKSEGKKAEVDFLFEIGGRVLPLEVKAGTNPKSKSLSSFDKYYKPDLLLRTTLLNKRRDNKVINLPLYAIGCLSRYPGLD